MIIFNEGIPGSGKTYNAVVEHLIPALISRRLCYVRIDGLDKEDCLIQLSKVCEIPRDELEDYLVYLPKDSNVIRSIANPKINNQDNPYFIKDGSFVILDELKDYFPATRELPPKEIINFVGEHRKRKTDLLIIDQCLNDVHQIFRRRVDTLYRFTKLDYFGLKNHYRYIVFRGIPSDKETKFVRLKSGFNKYREHYYKCYRSFITESQENDYDQYGADKTNVFKTPKFIFALFLIVGLLTFGFGYLRSFFGAEQAPKIVKSEHKIQSVQTVEDGTDMKTQASVSVKSDKEIELEHVERMKKMEIDELARKQRDEDRKKQEDEQNKKREIEEDKAKEYVRSLMKQGKPRIAGFLSKPGSSQLVIVEFCDQNGRVFDRLDESQLNRIGWELKEISHNYLRMRNKKYGDDYVVTSWPIQQLNRVSDRQNQEIREHPIHYPNVVSY